MEPVSINVAGPARRLLAGCLLRTQPDEKLIALYREGHEGAFEEIDRRYRARLTAYAGSFVGADRAEDVLQESLARAAKALRADDRDVQLGPWLFRIVRNGSLNTLRDAPPAHAFLDESIDGVEQPPDAVLRREELQETVAAVQGLPASQREALVRREVEGESLADIGTSMGVSSGAVGLLIFRARTALRESCGLVVPVGLLRFLLGGAGGTGVATSGVGVATLSKGVAAIAIGSAALGGGIAIERAVETPPPAAIAETVPAGKAGAGPQSESGSAASGDQSTASAAPSQGGDASPSRAVGQSRTQTVSSAGSVAGADTGERPGDVSAPDVSGDAADSPTQPPPGPDAGGAGSSGDYQHRQPWDGDHHMDGGGFNHDGPGGYDGGEQEPPPGSGDHQQAPLPGSEGSYSGTQQPPPPPDGSPTYPTRSGDGFGDRLGREVEPTSGVAP